MPDADITKELDALHDQVQRFDAIPHHVLVLMLSRITLWKMVHPNLMDTLVQMNTTITKEEYEAWKSGQIPRC